MAKILYLGVVCELVDFLKKGGNEVICKEGKISEDFILNEKFDFLISYRYRYIVPHKILRYFDRSAVNLHTSLLPFNRGADPNFWSFVDGSPNGVSIHYMSEGLDKGEIIAQEQVFFDAKEHSFSSSYEILQEKIKSLFKQNWSAIRSKTCPKIAQDAIWEGQQGSCHKSSDKDKFMPFLTNGWDTNIASFLEILKKNSLV